MTQPPDGSAFRLWSSPRLLQNAAFTRFCSRIMEFPRILMIGRSWPRPRNQMLPRTRRKVACVRRSHGTTRPRAAAASTLPVCISCRLLRDSCSAGSLLCNKVKNSNAKLQRPLGSASDCGVHRDSCVLICNKVKIRDKKMQPPHGSAF